MDPNKEPTPNNEKTKEPMTPEEILGWIEFSCWTMLVLAPFLYWVNGPAVSTDQFVVRTGLVTIAFTGGITIRLTKWIRGRRKQ